MTPQKPKKTSQKKSSIKKSSSRKQAQKKRRSSSTSSPKTSVRKGMVKKSQSKTRNKASSIKKSSTPKKIRVKKTASLGKQKRVSVKTPQSAQRLVAKTLLGPKKKVKRLSVPKPKNRIAKGGHRGAVVKVVGVGGGGGNAVSRMADYLPRSVELIAINTDLQDLEFCEARRRIYIGKNTTRGLGAGMNPELGRQSAEENREEIASALEGADVVFLTAGFGGGTGSGALPVVAEIAKEMGIITIAIITKPFSFEGDQRSHIAYEAIARLKDRVDTYIIIPNDKIFSIIDKDTSLQRAFLAIDEVLKNAVLGVAELILTPGIINVDFADIKTVVENSGPAIIGVGVGSGKDRALTAANAAINSPLLETAIDGAKGVLFSVSGHRDLKMSEVQEVARLISEGIDPTARVIFGTYHDRRLSKGQVKVTLIATGFGASLGRNYSLFGDFDIFAKHDIISETDEHEPKNVIQEEIDSEIISRDSEGEDDTLDVPDADQEALWEIPAFLRKRKKK